MEFKQAVITKQGRELMARLLSGSATTQFTKIAISSTAYPDLQLENLTSLSNVKMTAPAQAYGNNTATVAVTAAVENTGLAVGFDVNTVGLYAVDPVKGEILYSVSSASVKGYMPADTGVSKSGFNFKIYVEIGNAAQVNLEVDPAAFATQFDVGQLQTELTQFKNNKNLIPYWELGGLVWETGQEYDQASRIRTPFIKVSPDTEYAFSLDGNTQYLNTFLYDQYKRIISTVDYHTLAKNKITTTGKTAYVRLVSQFATDVTTHYQMEKGTVSKYAPHLQIVREFVGIDDLINDQERLVRVSADLKGKIVNDTISNPHKVLVSTAATLGTPSGGGYPEVSEQSSYNSLSDLDGNALSISSVVNLSMRQMLFQWDIISDIDLRYPKLFSRFGAQTRPEKVEVAKLIISSVIVNVWGTGSSQGGSTKLNFKRWVNNVWEPIGIGVSDTEQRKLSLGTSDSGVISKFLTSGGFCYCVAYADPSDGIEPSKISINYANLEYSLKFKPSDLFVSETKYQQEIGAIKTWIQQQGGNI